MAAKVGYAREIAMSANAAAPPGPEAWRVQNMRLIAFPREPQSAVPQSWWREVTGAEPESVSERRQKQEKEESGVYEGTLLTLGLDLLRIQWTVAPQLDAESINLEEQPPVLGPFVQRKNWFRDLMERWLPRCPPIHRLAFTASLLQPTSNHQTGYELLNRYLRWVDIDPQSSEFLYRINRRRPSGTGIPNLMLNRLSTWVVAKFGVLVAAVGGGHPEQQFRPTENYACAVELDINTTPDFTGLLPQDNLIRIFTELVEAGVDIAQNGDARP